MRNRRTGSGRAGAVLLLIFALTAVLAGIIAPHDPWARAAPFEPPGPRHWLGTNDLGQDILSELIHGSRVSLTVGLGAALIATAIGLLVGLAAGYFRGTADEILMGATDVVLMIPRIPLIVILAAFIRPGFWWIALIIGGLWWTSTARVVRSRTLQVREMDFIRAARCLGFSHFHILRSDVLPRIVPVVLPKFLLTIASAMISEASLSFLGLGDPSMKSWGMMLNTAFTRGGFVNEMWWWFLPPGLCICMVTGAVVLLGFSMEKAPAPDIEIGE